MRHVLLFNVLGSNGDDKRATEGGEVSPGVSVKLDKVGMLASKDPVLKSIGIELTSVTREVLRLTIVEPGNFVLSLFNEVLALNETEAERVLVDLSNAIEALLIRLVARVENEGDVGESAELCDGVVVLELGDGGTVKQWESVSTS